MGLTAWLGPQGVFSTGEAAHVFFGSGPVQQRAERIKKAAVLASSKSKDGSRFSVLRSKRGRAPAPSTQLPAERPRPPAARGGGTQAPGARRAATAHPRARALRVAPFIKNGTSACATAPPAAANGADAVPLPFPLLCPLLFPFPLLPACAFLLPLS
jgi:hypothetical protein